MPNEIIKTESAVNLFGMSARACNVVANSETDRILNQKIVLSRNIDKNRRLAVTLRFDDECKNGHETFAITADLYDSRQKRERGLVACGCLHDEIAAHFPELSHLIKWHVCSVDGPMHYVANTCYLAGDRDCNGLAKGEKRQLRNGRTGEPCWHLVAIDANGEEIETYKLPKSVDGEKPENTYTLEWRAWCRTGKGKIRELDAARRAAVWPDATDEELCSPRAVLEEKLKARLPALLEAFKADMLACGFLWLEVK